LSALFYRVCCEPGSPFFPYPPLFRSHDRMIAPLYPLAFVAIAFAYLGAPRTTRQSRTLSMVGAIGGVGLVRLIGFASTVFGATRSEEHTSELQSREKLVCRLLLENKN